MHPLIPQAVGLLAVVLFVSSYQLKSRKSIIICNVVSRFLYILQYLLLGAISGAVLDILGTISSVIAEKKDSALVRRYSKTIFILMSALMIASGVSISVINKNPLDLFALVGILLQSGAFWLTKEATIRKVSLLGSPFWLTYNLSSKAYGSAVGDALTMISIIVAMIKYKNSARPKENKQ